MESVSKLFAKDRELRGEMQDLLALAKSEKRALTETEQSRFNEIKEERMQIAMEVEATRELREQELPKEKIERSFAKMCYRTLREGGSTQLEVRDVITETGINDSQVPVLLQSIIKPLQKKYILDQLGLQVISGVHGEPVWSYQGAINASVEGENTKVGESKIDFSALRSTPKRIAVSVPVSNRAVSQSNYDLYSIVTSAMGEAVARKLNEIVLSDSAVGTFKGLFQDLDTANKLNAPLDWGGIVDLESAVLNNNVEVNKDTCAYVLNTKAYGQLKKTVVEKGDSKLVLDVNSNVLNGYKLLVSNYVKDGKALFADFGLSGAAYFGGANLIIDPYSRARENLVEFTLNIDADIIRFRKEAFAELTIKKPSGGA